MKNQYPILVKVCFNAIVSAKDVKKPPSAQLLNTD